MEKGGSISWWSLMFLGGCEIKVLDRPITLETQKSSALLAYLVLNPKPQPREKLAGLFWGDLPEGNARRNLRHALWDLRVQLTPPGSPTLVQTDNETVWLDRQGADWVDVEVFQQLVERCLSSSGQELPDSVLVEDLQQAVALYQGDFLESILLSNAPVWEEWMMAYRERLHLLALNAYERLAQVHIQQGNLEAALSSTRRLLAMDPWRETAHRQLMLLLATDGQRTAALAQYETCRRVLDTELGVEPDITTRELYEQIRTGALPLTTQAHPAPRIDLPIQPDTFIGRERELAELSQWLSDPACRLITLYGPGGTGKTRLAVQSVAQKTSLFPAGVHFISLDSVETERGMLAAIANGIKLSPDSGQELKDKLFNHLSNLSSPLLLLLDNFEQLQGAAPQVAWLLSATSFLKVLVTSRSLLHLKGEHAYPVPPLRLPDGEQLLPFEDLARNEAVALFVTRASQARYGFTLTCENARAVAMICTYLDGLPLAIELAAARIQILSPSMLVKGLIGKKGLQWLASGSTDRPDRHRNLWSTVDWSYRLLNEKERGLFSCLGVFSGGFNLDAAEWIGEPLGLGGASILDCLNSLVDKSMLRLLENAGDEPRFTLLETVREYAMGRLSTANEEMALKRQHAGFYLELVERAGPELKGESQEAWIRRLDLEQANLRAVLQYYQDEKDVAAGLRLTGSLWRYWYIRGELVEGRHWLETYLAMSEQIPSNPLWKAHALNGAGVLARNQGDFGKARQYFVESLDLFRLGEDQVNRAEALGSLGATLLDLGEYDQARALFEECLSLQEHLENKWGVALAQSNLAACLIVCQNDLDWAEELLEHSLTLRGDLGDKVGMAYTLNNLGVVMLSRDKYKPAKKHCGRSLELFKELGDKVGMAAVLNSLGEIAAREGDSGQSLVHYQEALKICLETGDQEDAMIALEGLASPLIAFGNSYQAAVLLGAAEKLREKMQLPLYPEERQHHDQMLMTLQAQLAEHDMQEAWQNGGRMNFREVIQYTIAQS